MNELKPNTDIKLSGQGRATESMALAGLTSLINVGDIKEGDDGPSMFAPPPDAVPSRQEQQQARVPGRRGVEVIQAPAAPAPAKAIAPVPTALAEPKVLPARIFTTGRLKRGKDHFLDALGFAKIGFADPIYALQEYFFGTRDKSAPGARKFLQTAGQWGRGLVNEQYPLTPMRALFCMMITTLGAAGRLPDDSVDWKNFGHDRLWIDALLKRADALMNQDVGPGRVAISNVRFENEYKAMTDAGWTHYHVMCSQATWERRLREAGMKPNDPTLVDTSEQMAIALDNDTLKHIQVKPRGGKLRVIWNDDEVAPPSNRFYTLRELA